MSDIEVDANGVTARLRGEDVRIMQLCVCGLTYAEIGQRVGLSHRTVYARVLNVRDALGVDTRIEALVLLLSAGIISREVAPMG